MSQLKVLDIFRINSISGATFMYSYHHNLLPNSFHDLFLSSNEVRHQYETRLASQYRPHFCRTNIKQFSILYRGPKIWNSLPVSLISSPSIFVVKKNLKNYLISIATLKSVLCLGHFISFSFATEEVKGVNYFPSRANDQFEKGCYR